MLKRLLDFHRLHADLVAARVERQAAHEKLAAVWSGFMGGSVPTGSPADLRAKVEARLMDHGLRQRDLGYNEGYLAALHSSGAMDVVSERRRQVRDEGFTDAHDDAHDGRQLAEAARCYVERASWDDDDREWMADAAPFGWPWGQDAFRPSSRRGDLVKAGALILAEIERLDRLADREAQAAVAEALKTIQPAPRFSDRLRTLLRNLRPRLYAARAALAKGSN